MSNGRSSPRLISRRNVLKAGGAIAAAAGLGVAPRWAGGWLSPADPAAAAGVGVTLKKHLVATDGWLYIPGTVMDSTNSYVASPDPYAPAPFTTYVFGFRDVTALSADHTSDSTQVLAQKGHAQGSAPLLFFDENDGIQITLSNLGLQQRPDLVDSHTIHWHGFRNALPIFDGVPEMSISVPIGSDFPYYFHPTDPGTYMYHCHFEDVEHVQMGMDGIVFVRPAQNKSGYGSDPATVARYNGGPSSAPLGYVYNDGNGLTAYDREFSMFLHEFWATSHYDDAHVQNADWSDYHSDFFLMNGRSYPDTLAPNGGGTDLSTGYLIAPAGRADLQYQPISSLVQCTAGDRVLLRVVNLGYTQASMRLSGIPMHIVGKDATPLRGLSGGTRSSGGADTSYFTDTIYIGAGESYDAIFTAPAHTGAGYDTYLFYNNALGYLTRPGGPGLGGQMTEIRVYATGALPAQTAPNT